MECSCNFSVDSDGSCEIIDKKWVSARKEHKCVECRKKIVIGEKYYIEKTKFDGEFDTYKTCIDCHSLRGLFSNFYYGEIRSLVSEEIDYCGGEIPEKCISKLTPNARAFVCDEIEKYWEDEDE